MKNQNPIVEMIPDICRALRGNIPQSELNSKLNFKGNIISKWECGTRQLSWEEFVDLCHLTQHDLRKVLTEHFLYSGDAKDQVELLMHMCAAIPEDLDQYVIPGLKPTKIKALLSGKDSLCLDEFLLLLDILDEAWTFLSLLLQAEVDSEHLVRMRDYMAMLELTKANHFVLPLFSWISGKGKRPFSFEQMYQLAEVFGVTQDELQKILAEFIQLKILKHEENQYFLISDNLPANTRSSDYAGVQNKNMLYSSILSHRFLTSKVRTLKDRNLFVYIPFPKGGEVELEKVIRQLGSPLTKLKRKAIKEGDYDFVILNIAHTVFEV